MGKVYGLTLQLFGAAFLCISLMHCSTALAQYPSCEETGTGCQDIPPLPCANGNGNCDGGNTSYSCTCKDDPAVQDGCACQLTET